MTDAAPSLYDLAIHYATDKMIDYASGHNYIPGYVDIFESRRHDIHSILEIGIGLGQHYDHRHFFYSQYSHGNSLKMWCDYFPMAHVYGIDIHECPPIPPPQGDRITTMVADQSNYNDLMRVLGTIGGSIDIVIDDGSHLLEHQVASFIHLCRYISPHGVYVIEDVAGPNIEAFKSLNVFPQEIRDYIQTHFKVRWYDTRNDTGLPDDFLMVFQRIQ